MNLSSQEATTLTSLPRELASRRALVLPEAVEAVWSRLHPMLSAFKAAVRDADHGAIGGDDSGSSSAQRVVAMFKECECAVDEALGSSSSLSDETKAAVGARLQIELLPYLLLSESAERAYSNPRGYAGDYLTIAKYYEDTPRGAGRIGPILDRGFLNLAAVRAVQNRRGLLAGEIRAAIARAPGGVARVTSLACGPATELFDVYDALEDKSQLSSSLVDLDLQALAHVADRRDRARLKGRMELSNENLVHVARGQRSLGPVDRDLIYSIGLIDYFKDDFVVRLMNVLHASLRPGGRALLGNFHPRNGTRAFMDHVLDWKLIHRTEEDMSRLFAASAFGRPCSRVLYEEQGINLFAECIKE